MTIADALHLVDVLTSPVAAAFHVQPDSVEGAAMRIRQRGREICRGGTPSDQCVRLARAEFLKAFVEGRT